MTTMMPVTLTCPNCGHEVQSQSLSSTNCVGMTTDLHRITAGFNPLQFLIHSCQSCGFTGGEDEFQGSVDPAVAVRIDEQIRPHIRDERLKPDARWEFAAFIAEWRGQDQQVIAGLYLNAAWCADTLDKEHYYRRRAADWFEQALDAGVQDRPVIIYLIGELYRRVGDVAVASRWFDEAITEAEGHPEAGRIEQIALQRKLDPKETL